MKKFLSRLKNQSSDSAISSSSFSSITSMPVIRPTQSEYLGARLNACRFQLERFEGMIEALRKSLNHQPALLEIISEAYIKRIGDLKEQIKELEKWSIFL